jgi:hypothetical protein
MEDVKYIGVETQIGDADSKPTVATVVFGEACVSVKIGNITLHIPWSELAAWHVWLAQAYADISG